MSKTRLSGKDRLITISNYTILYKVCHKVSLTVYQPNKGQKYYQNNSWYKHVIKSELDHVGQNH